MLHLSGEENIKDVDSEFISSQDLAQQNIDSVYNSLSMQERYNLLSVHSIKSSDTSIVFDSLETNGFLFDLRTQSFEKSASTTFEKEPLRIGLAKTLDSNSVNRAVIGQSGRDKLAYYAQAIDMENAKKSGANIVLSPFFQSNLYKWENQEFAFQESPLASEKYWSQILQASEDNGIKIGIHDFFFKEEKLNKTEYADYLALGLSGNRYYSRKGHGIIQMNDDMSTFTERIPQFKSSSRQSFLRNSMGFEGIILSEDFSQLNDEEQISNAMKSLSDGSDLVCISARNKKNLLVFLETYFNQNQENLKLRCMRILRMKYDLFHGKNKSTSFGTYSKPFEYQSHQAAITCVKNTNNQLPINNLHDTVLFKTSDENITLFSEKIEHYAPSKAFQSKSKTSLEIVLLDGFGNDIDDAIRIATNSQDNYKYILLTDAGSFYRRRTSNFSKFSSIIIMPQDLILDKSLAIQAVFGAFDFQGNLPFYHTPQFPPGSGLKIKSLNRLKYINAAYLGIDESYLKSIDNIAEGGISAKAFPGCQIMFGVDGHVVYQKNYGFHDYSKTKPVLNNTIYDIASISKIAASTVSLMALQGEGKFSLEDSLTNLIPEVVGDNPMKNIWLKDMMAHQAGLPAWVPFYLKTLQKGQPSSAYYSNKKTGDFILPVAQNLWIRKDYPDTIYSRILSCDLKGKSYVYSDLGYYFVKKIIEKKSQKPMQDYVDERIYRQLGLQSMTYNPFLKYNLDRIAPTENDRTFRKQVVHGYVHDPGSAMMGGVGGHAGVFSTANDLYVLMQMLLNKGTYAGKEILKEAIVDEFTSVQFPGRNRRGAGFDKPNLNGSAATACSSASPSSFGHSGFTGTLAWADPQHKINFVFLSNRVYPNAENWKIVKMNIRTNIQTKIYESVKDAKNFNFLVSN